MNTDVLPKAIAPWYQQPWLWFVVSWPIAAILAGSVTIYIAFSGADGLVADDYYKRGLAINRELKRDHAAAALHLRAQGRYDAERERITIDLSADRAQPWPPTLTLRVIHPMQPQGDQRVSLASAGEGVYVANITITPGIKRRLILEAETWRLSGEWMVGERSIMNQDSQGRDARANYDFVLHSRSPE